MEHPDSPRKAALTYAGLSLAVRLLASQCAIFSLWFGRSAYERSRGELITMLYEKTLSRKVVSVSSEARADEGCKSNGNGKTKKAARSSWRKLVDIIKKPFGLKRTKTGEESKELASMGKIVNLMR